MTTELLGQTGFTVEMKQFYDKKLLSVAEMDMVYMQYGAKRPIPARGGKSIEWRTFTKYDATPATYVLTEGTLPTSINGTVSNVAATISQYGAYSRVSDLLETQGYDPVLAEMAEKFGLQMQEVCDTVVQQALSSATTLQYADIAIQVGTSGTGAVGSGQYLTAAELMEMKRTLRRNGARMINGAYVCFIHPDNTKDLMEDPDIRDDFRWTDPSAIKEGKIGRWMGIDFVETNNLRVRASYGMSGADVYEVVMFGNEYYGVTELSALSAKMIIHPRGTGGHFDPLEQYSTVGWKAALAGKILNDNFGGLIYCASSRSNAA